MSALIVPGDPGFSAANPHLSASQRQILSLQEQIKELQGELGAEKVKSRALTVMLACTVEQAGGTATLPRDQHARISTGGYTVQVAVNRTEQVTVLTLLASPEVRPAEPVGTEQPS